MLFDETIDRIGTNAVKWSMKEMKVPEDAIPLWVADMDFPAPPKVIEALSKRVAHGIYGYTRIPDSYYEAVIHWMEKRHQWTIKKDWLVVMPGVIPALNVAVQTFTEEGDAIMIQRPVYHPFTHAVVNNDRQLINSPLRLEGNRYVMDLEDFEAKISKHQVKMVILCSPHNPVGRVWTREELIAVADICVKHRALMVVDEIHHDLIYPRFCHTPLASIDPKYEQFTITCTAPSKTFNLAGLKVANIIISNDNLRKPYQGTLKKLGFPSTNIFGSIACEVAYQTGEPWLQDLMEYLDDNKRYVQEYINERLPMIRMIETEATYLLWLDFRELKLSHQDLEHFLLHDAKIWLNQGKIFGEEGEGFFRMNIACPRKLLIEAMERLERAIQQRFSINP